MKYSLCKRSDLVTFAAHRNLLVTSSAQRAGSGPYKKDYVEVLKQADKDATFRFLDLAPELRNLVYKDLLVLQNSFHCYPQILASCSQISQEASSVLHCDNLIEIKIWADGVYTHGKRCGDYKPTQPWNGSDFTAIQWPTYLHRVRFLRVALPEQTWDINRQPVPFRSRLVTVGNVLHSLCSTLETGHMLRKLDVDLQLAYWLNETDEVTRAVESACYPLRLIGPKVGTQVAFGRILASSIDHDVSSAVAVSLKSSSFLPKVKLIYNCITLTASLVGTAYTVPGYGAIAGLLTAVTSVCATAGGVMVKDGSHMVTWERPLAGAIRALRAGLERADLTSIDAAILARVDELLHLEIDIRTAGDNA